MAKKHDVDMEKMRKIHEMGLHIHRGVSNPRWNDGSSEKRNYPCPNCGKPRMCKRRDSNRLCLECHYNRGKNFSLKEYYAKTRIHAKEEAIAYKGGSCTMCGISNLPMCCYHFHHVNREEKLFYVGRKFNQKMTDEILKELDKCILLCANCHAIYHYHEREDLAKAKKQAQGDLRIGEARWLI